MKLPLTDIDVAGNGKGADLRIKMEKKNHADTHSRGENTHRTSTIKSLSQKVPRVSNILLIISHTHFLPSVFSKNRVEVNTHKLSASGFGLRGDIVGADLRIKMEKKNHADTHSSMRRYEDLLYFKT
ncbi:hypothetical protein Tco_1151789 [Tanacetum coccineum]